MAATAWQLGIQSDLNAIGKIAANRNKTLTYVIPEGEYEFESLIVPANVSLIGGSGSTRSVRLAYAGKGNQTLITLRGYGSRFQGFDLVSKIPEAPRLTAIRLDGCLNPEIARLRVDLRGIDCVGLDIAGKESVKVDTVELRAAVPVLYRWADNTVFRDCDLGASGNIERLTDTVVLFGGMPHQVTFEGYQTWQGGKYAIFGEINSPSSGQGLNIYNLRYEQSTSKDDPKVAAVHLKFFDRHLENLLFVGCRWTDREKAFEVSNINKVTEIGSRLTGARG